MEQRDDAVNFDSCIIDCSIGQRYLDDSKCDNDRKHNHSNGPKEIHRYTFQVHVSIALGNMTFKFNILLYTTENYFITPHTYVRQFESHAHLCIFYLCSFSFLHFLDFRSKQCVTMEHR